MNQIRIAFLPNCQAKAQMVSQAPLNIGKLKGKKLQILVSLLTPIQFASLGKKRQKNPNPKPNHNPKLTVVLQHPFQEQTP